MANRKATMTDIRVIIREFVRGTSLREMERKLKISRTSLRAYRDRAEASGKSMVELLSLEDAELNAILNSPRTVNGCTIYVSLFPCNECAKAIIQAGIKEIVYESDKYATTDSTIASKKMLTNAGVSFRQLNYVCKVTVEKEESYQ